MTAPVDEMIAEVCRLDAEATPGPWQWYGNTKMHSCYLSTVNAGRVFVMQFDRWGFGCAQPTFQWPVGKADGSGTGLMYPLAKLPEEAGPDYEVDYRRDFVGIKHPDARLIAAYRTAAPLLAAEVERLTAELDAERGRREAAEAILDAYEEQWKCVPDDIFFVNRDASVRYEQHRARYGKAGK